MIKITDEILNKYIDSELSRDEIEQVNLVLRNSEELQKKFNALKLVHKELLNFREDEVSESFTNILMKQIVIKKFVLPKQQKYFIASVAAFITLLCLVIFGFSISALISSAPISAGHSKSIVDSISYMTDGFVGTIKKLFSGTGLSIIGSIFSIIVLISGYFFFEMQKRSKANLGNGHHL
jgi:hypothetical protein